MQQVEKLSGELPQIEDLERIPLRATPPLARGRPGRPQECKDYRLAWPSAAKHS